MPAKPAKAPVRARRTKAEVQQEFEAIRREAETARETADAKAEELARMQEPEIRATVEGVSVEGVVQQVSALGLEISRSLAGISEKLVSEVELLASVRQAIDLERKELARLHKIDVAATALDQLVQDYAREKERLEAEIAAQRAQWEQEARAAERERKDQDEALKRQRQREIDDYEYRKNLERKKAQDKYEEEMRQLEKANKEKQEALEKSWRQREAALKEQEQELARLRKEAEEFPARVQKAADEAAAQANRTAEQRLEQQILMLKKDAEGERRVAELQIQALNQVLQRQSDQIASLQKQLDEAKQQVQDIAVKAIEGASGAKTLAHINQIAMEQAKNRPSG